MFNNIKLIDKAFDKIINEEKRINYEYEPHIEKQDERWKRHLFFFELKKDFIKDVTEFGFCPHIQKPCEEQRRDKNIMRFQKVDKFVRTDYIKNLYKKIYSNNFKNNKRQKSVSPQKEKYRVILRKNNSMKDFYYKNKQKNANTFLSKIYTKLQNRKRELNNLRLTKILKQTENIENLLTKKNTKNDDGQFDIESFIYEPDNSTSKYNNYYISEKEKNEESNKEDSRLNISHRRNNQTQYSKSNKGNKKSGWRLTTSLENVKFFKNVNSAFYSKKNFDNNSNAISFFANKKINNNKFRIENRNSLSNNNLNKSPLDRNKIHLKKMKTYDKNKFKDKKYKLFSHVRKMKNEI